MGVSFGLDYWTLVTPILSQVPWVSPPAEICCPISVNLVLPFDSNIDGYLRETCQATPFLDC